MGEGTKGIVFLGLFSHPPSSQKITHQVKIEVSFLLIQLVQHTFIVLINQLLFKNLHCKETLILQVQSYTGIDLLFHIASKEHVEHPFCTCCYLIPDLSSLTQFHASQIQGRGVVFESLPLKIEAISKAKHLAHITAAEILKFLPKGSLKIKASAVISIAIHLRSHLNLAIEMS